MNDNELIAAVKDSVTGVHMNIPAGTIVRRSRAIRARWRIPGLAGVLAVVAGAALAVTTVLPSSHPAGARLAAWTVAGHPGGSIYVTIREMRDPAGLQSRLRADGLPVNVSFSGPPLSRNCQAYPAGKDLLRSVGSSIGATGGHSWSSTRRLCHGVPAWRSPTSSTMGPWRLAGPAGAPAGGRRLGSGGCRSAWCMPLRDAPADC